MEPPLRFAAFLLLLAPAAPQDRPQPFALASGERIVLLGNTFFERDLRHNYLEALLVSRHPDRELVFRNLGWDGDTVWGHARAGFGNPKDGFRNLLKQVGEAKPTVILLAYGMNESFAGEAGLREFSEGLHQLLEALVPTGARLVLLSPIKHEALGPPLPNPAERNRLLRLYAEAIAKTARERSLRYVDLFDSLGEGPAPLTDNGIHLNENGYRRAALAIEASLGFAPRRWSVEMDLGKDGVRAEGTKVLKVDPFPNKVTFRAKDDLLPAPGERSRLLTVRSLTPGFYALKAGGIRLAGATGDEWGRGVTLTGSAETERLREAIAYKNLVYYQYWRPQNDTYIFGFRKREQGHLQAEFPQFPPLVAQKEAEIAKLRVPPIVEYVLEPE
jgi:lysophospholipase L1-like esterase